MTHDELLAKIEHFRNVPFDPLIDALRAVVELHKPFEIWCEGCNTDLESNFVQMYPCPTIQAIEKELK